MQKLNAQLGVAMQQAGQSSSQPMLLPQLLAANPQLQQQLPMMMSNALDTVLFLTLAVVCRSANDLAAADVSSDYNALKTLVQKHAAWHFCQSLSAPMGHFKARRQRFPAVTCSDVHLLQPVMPGIGPRYRADIRQAVSTCRQASHLQCSSMLPLC